MSGGEIKNITGWNANGVAFGMWSSSEANRSTFNMTGGLITGCSSIYGPDNGRTAAVYLHNLSKMVMTGGTISGNSGMGCPGGIDSSRVNSILIIGRADQEFDNEAWKESYAAAYNPDNHPFVVDNSSYYESKTDLYQHTALVNWKLTGGIYTSDVTLYCAPGYVCIPDEDSERTDDYIVVPGFRVDYYSASEESVTDPETGVESTVYNTQLVATRFHLLKKDQTLADLKAESITVQLDATSAISDWYMEAALENAYDFDTALMGNLSLYGGVEEVIEDGEAPKDPKPNVPKTGDNEDLALAMFGMLLSLAAIAVVLKNKKFFA
jgi:LPXTG-motif cell wall-anchored protein